MYWLEITVTADEQAADHLAEILRPFAEGESVAIEQLGDPRDLDPNALLPEHYLKIYVAEEQDTPELRQQIEAAVAPYPITFTPLQETDWANAWKDHYHPLRIGRRFWIQPSWQEPDQALPTDLIITLDPGMAFGTGQHPTTQLCLSALEDWLEPGQSVLDLGTGSGILAIGAALLGASEILAVDNDRWAVQATHENAALNQLTDRMTIVEGTLANVATRNWDVAVVNILATVIINLLQEENLLEYGRLFIFSGIVAIQEEEFTAALTAAGGHIHQVLRQEDWLAIVATRA
ncbi:MAG: 50S ribosomal protein L11 methyltransferase [Chloroflexi bacterium]|nr:50S ribosomal protein L11 methyltransferase [Chloroflexota bacterium]